MYNDDQIDPRQVVDACRFVSFLFSRSGVLIPFVCACHQLQTSMPTLLDVFALRGAIRVNLVVTFEPEKNSSLQAVENLEDKGVLSSGAVVGEQSTASLVVEKHQEEEEVSLLLSKKKHVEGGGMLSSGAVNSLLQAVENLEDKGVLSSGAAVGEKLTTSLAVEKHQEEQGMSLLSSKKNHVEEGMLSSGAVFEHKSMASRTTK